MIRTKNEYIVRSDRHFHTTRNTINVPNSNGGFRLLQSLPVAKHTPRESAGAARRGDGHLARRPLGAAQARVSRVDAVAAVTAKTGGYNSPSQTRSGERAPRSLSGLSATEARSATVTRLFRDSAVESRLALESETSVLSFRRTGASFPITFPSLGAYYYYKDYCIPIDFIHLFTNSASYSTILSRLAIRVYISNVSSGDPNSNLIAVCRRDYMIQILKSNS